MEIAFGSRLKHAWNAFLGNETFGFRYPLGPSSSYRPDRPIFSRGNERSIITSVYNRIALDASSIAIQHARLDEDGRFTEVIDSSLNSCLSLEANLDQTGRAFIQDVVMSVLDEGYNFAESLVCAVGAGVGFMVAMVLFSGVRKRLEDAQPPKCFEGLPITLVAASVTSLSFMGFGGIVENIFAGH